MRTHHPALILASVAFLNHGAAFGAMAASELSSITGGVPSASPMATRLIIADSTALAECMNQCEEEYDSCEKSYNQCSNEYTDCVEACD